MAHKDFKKYFCTTHKRHIWTLGYFGGGPVNFKSFKEKAEQFSKETGVPIDEVNIDEILYSSAYKGFKFLYSSVEDQKPLEDSVQYEDVMKLLHH